ncbi:MAG: bifunctional GNAT family N-acetyltransferase/carbon-nitrogen hydrolase family protein [Planctomycetes bacterium]|nr:bifunctional GNAT family N-acetyltransferase/carbon-nitrogen hydrolase family protein [Planctomycetota bacterium]
MAAPDPDDSRTPSGPSDGLASSSKLRLGEFERHVVLRRLCIEDFEQLVAMQEACFPGMVTWKREQIESQLSCFPDGQSVIEHQGQIVASASSLIVDFDEYADWHNWKVIADGGYIRNHDPEGDTLYGIEVMVHPHFRGLKLARRLYAARKDLCRRLNLARIIIGGRIPGYHEHSHTLSAREYVEKVINRGLYDPVLTTQTANGFVLKRLIPEYFPSDVESRGFATFLEWTNLDYQPGSRFRMQRVSLVRICAVQYEMRLIHSFEEFATQCEFFIDTASDYKSDFVLFPELFTSQLLTTIKAKHPAEAARQLADLTPRYLDTFTALAIRYNVNIVGGSQFAVEDGELRNVSYLFRRDGTIGRQYKIHITPAERRWWGVKQGNKVEVFDTDRGKIAILICYDVEFPELARIAASKGAQIVFVPFNTDNRNGYLRIRHCAQARCIENHQYVVISGCVGNLPFVENADVHYAQSGIFTPADFSFAREGVAAECMPNIETLIVQDVDIELLRRHKQRGSVQNWNDRRTDLYRVEYRDGRDGPEFSI